MAEKEIAVSPAHSNDDIPNLFRQHGYTLIPSSTPELRFISIVSKGFPELSGARRWRKYVGQYRKAVQLFTTWENVVIIPKYNIKLLPIKRLVDFGFCCNNLDDFRMFAYPYTFIRFREYLQLITDGVIYDHPDRHFCAFIVSSKVIRYNKRKDFFQLLSRYKEVHSYGKTFHNRDFPAHLLNIQQFEAVQNVYQQYKFVICFENSIAENYITEKILLAYSAGAIPIYCGAPNLSEYFNTEAVINYDDYGSFEAMVDKVIELDQDDAKYEAFRNQPFLKDPNLLQSMDDALASFFDEVYAEIVRRRKYRRWQAIKQDWRYLYYDLEVLINRVKDKLSDIASKITQ